MANYFGNRSPNAFQEFIQGTQAAALEDRERVKNAMLQRQFQDQNALQQALQNYTPGGDVTPIMRTNPQVGIAMERQNLLRAEMQRKKQADAFKSLGSAMEYMYLISPELDKDPAKYGQVKEKIGEITQGLGLTLPDTWDKSTGETFRNNYLKMRGKLPKQFQSVGGMLWDATNQKWINPPISPAKREELAIKKDRNQIMRDRLGKSTDYGTFRENYLTQNPDAPEEEIRQKWSLKTEADIPRWAIDKASAELLKDADFQAGYVPGTTQEFGKNGATTKQDYLLKKAKSYIDAREKLRGGSKQKPKSLKEMSSEEIKALIQQKQGQ